MLRKFKQYYTVIWPLACLVAASQYPARTPYCTVPIFPAFRHGAVRYLHIQKYFWNYSLTPSYLSILTLSPLLFISLAVCLPLCVSPFVSTCLSSSHLLCLPLFISLSKSFCLSLYLFPSLCLALCLSPSPYPPLGFSLSISSFVSPDSSL